ncbi:hypothetical protein [Pseudomonas putida]|uniref:hypothetical protein n=1 Tax=Pseudomonas TaxID=286 RepID=UPI003466D7E1
MALLPDQIYSYLTMRPRHAGHLQPEHRELEAKTLRRIRNKRIDTRSTVSYHAGSFPLDDDSDPYGQSLGGILQADLATAAEVYTGSRNLGAAPNLASEWETLEALAILYCHPIPRKKKA